MRLVWLILNSYVQLSQMHVLGELPSCEHQKGSNIQVCITSAEVVVSQGVTGTLAHAVPAVLRHGCARTGGVMCSMHPYEGWRLVQQTERPQTSCLS